MLFISIPLSAICASCRRYGVKLIDNLCEPCYTLHRPPRQHFSPGELPNVARDLITGLPIRTSKTYQQEHV